MTRLWESGAQDELLLKHYRQIMIAENDLKALQTIALQ